MNIKWGKERFENIEMDLDSDVQTFKALIYSMTMVPVDKQKIMAKGKILKDDTDLKSFGFKNVFNLI